MAILNVIVDDELKARIDTAARAEDRTIRSVVEMALRRYFEEADAALVTPEQQMTFERAARLSRFFRKSA